MSDGQSGQENMDRAAELMDQILAELLNVQELDDPAWDTLTMLALVDPGVTELTAYRYTGAERGVPTDTPGAALELMCELQAATQAPNGDLWTACIIKVERDSAQVNIDFKYGDDAEPYRTQVPGDMILMSQGTDRLGELLRPRPEDFQDQEQ